MQLQNLHVSLLHVIAGCKTYFNEGRFTWRHDSALNFLASSLQCMNHCTFYVELPQYLSPCLVTGDDLRPDMLISSSDTLYVIELVVGFEAEGKWFVQYVAKNLSGCTTRFSLGTPFA